MNREGSGRGTTRPRLLSIRWGTGEDRTLEVGSRNIFAVSLLDPDSLTYTVQHQVLGSDQWTALVTGLREPEWAATGLKKGLQHIFRVLSSSGKSSSKPSAPSEPVQLLEHGEPNAVWMGVCVVGAGVSGGGSRAIWIW